jgi:GntR family transcriptional regulator, transcriptional repressor for pyruvate dehydrogenase complex
MKFQKINKIVSAEIIVHQILESVTSGTIKPGDKLPPERELAQMFGVCRASVREATRALTLMGYLEVFQGKGAFLRDDVDRDEISSNRLSGALAAAASLDLVEIRDVLECKTVALASQRATAAQLEAIEGAVERMEQSQDNVPGFYAADLEFHQALAEAANNAVLIEMMNLLRSKMIADRDGFLGFSTGDRDACADSARRVFEAVKGCRSGLAVEEMGKHLNLVTSEVQSVIGADGDGIRH